MGVNKVQVISTKEIEGSLIRIAELYQIQIDEIPFIEVKPMITSPLRERVNELSNQKAIVVFTSVNAVSAIDETLSEVPPWRVFCIGHKTREAVADVFGDERIEGTGNTARELAGKITASALQHPLIFFSGDQRRSELPDHLKGMGIPLEEWMVYQTVETPRFLSKRYDGILFFSPSAVRSYFSVNAMNECLQVFAIGPTTEREIAHFTPLPVIVAEDPDIEKLICQVIRHFKKSKNS